MTDIAAQRPVDVGPPCHLARTRRDRHLSGADDSVEQQREQLLEQWTSQHPQNRAVIRPASDNADEQHSAMVSDAQSGTSVALPRRAR